MMINGRDPVPRIGKRATRYGGRSGEDDCVRRALPITSSSSTSRTLSLSSRTDGDRLVGKPKRIRSWLAALPSPDYPCRWGGSCRQLQVGRGGWAFGAIQSWNFSGVARCLSTPCGYVGTTDLGGCGCRYRARDDGAASRHLRSSRVAASGSFESGLLVLW